MFISQGLSPYQRENFRRLYTVVTNYHGNLEKSSDKHRNIVLASEYKLNKTYRNVKQKYVHLCYRASDSYK